MFVLAEFDLLTFMDISMEQALKLLGFSAILGAFGLAMLGLGSLKCMEKSDSWAWILLEVPFIGVILFDPFNWFDNPNSLDMTMEPSKILATFGAMWLVASFIKFYFGYKSAVFSLILSLTVMVTGMVWMANDLAGAIMAGIITFIVAGTILYGFYQAIWKHV